MLMLLLVKLTRFWVFSLIKEVSLSRENVNGKKINLKKKMSWLEESMKLPKRPKKGLALPSRCLNILRIGVFGAAHGWWKGGKSPP